MTTDQGRQFESQLFQQLNQLLGIKRFRPTAYHPQANRMIERFHRTLKTSLKCKNNMNWSHELPLILLGLRSTVKEDINATPAGMLNGKTLRLPYDFFIESKSLTNEVESIQNFRRMMDKIRPTTAAHHNKNQKFFIQIGLMTSSHVFVRNDTVR